MISIINLRQVRFKLLYFASIFMIGLLAFQTGEYIAITSGARTIYEQPKTAAIVLQVKDPDDGKYNALRNQGVSIISYAFKLKDNNYKILEPQVITKWQQDSLKEARFYPAILIRIQQADAATLGDIRDFLKQGGYKLVTYPEN